jgi:ribosomal protein S14
MQIIRFTIMSILNAFATPPSVKLVRSALSSGLYTHETYFEARNGLSLNLKTGSWRSLCRLGVVNKTSSVAFSSQGNYTDWSTATGRWISVPTFADRGVSRCQRDGTPTAVNLSSLGCSRYIFFEVAPHLCSRDWVDRFSDPQLENLVALGIVPRTSVAVARNFGHYPQTHHFNLE